MRDGFREIVDGWMLIDDFNDLTDRIERSAEWKKANGPLEPDEQATAEFMIKAQIARGMPDLIRALGMEREFGLPPDDAPPKPAKPMKAIPCPACKRKFRSAFALAQHRRNKEH